MATANHNFHKRERILLLCHSKVGVACKLCYLFGSFSIQVKAMDQVNHFEVKDYNLELVSSKDEPEIGEQKEKIYPVYPSKGSLDAKTIESCIQK